MILPVQGSWTHASWQLHQQLPVHLVCVQQIDSCRPETVDKIRMTETPPTKTGTKCHITPTEVSSWKIFSSLQWIVATPPRIISAITHQIHILEKFSQNKHVVQYRQQQPYYILHIAKHVFVKEGAFPFPNNDYIFKLLYAHKFASGQLTNRVLTIIVLPPLAKKSCLPMSNYITLAHSKG